MAELDLCDILKLEEYNISEKAGEFSIEILNGGGEFSSIINEIPTEKNLIFIAVRNYLNAIGSGGHFTFSLTKNIPSGAGLGGGSSNAAAALKLVSGIFGRGIDDDLLHAASVSGSDVSFFLKGGFAFVEGRGEIVAPLTFTDDSFVLLVNNGIHVNTGLAYDSLKKPVSDMEIDCNFKKKVIQENISLKTDWINIFRNDFEESIFRLYPQIGLIKEKMYYNGAFFSLMTGSGSTVFGLFKDESSARNVQVLLEKEGNKVYFTKFRSRKN
jgi:4-diphosphocytidyl-2-C-methyl-D-erythritol kinase